MSFPQKEELINYRIERAVESIEAARLMSEKELYNPAVNRLYYACFYILLAWAAKENLSISTHAGVKTKFNELLAKPQKINPQLARLYNDLFNKRQDADYMDFYSFDENTVNQLLPKVSEFIETIKNLGLLT